MQTVVTNTCLLCILPVTCRGSIKKILNPRLGEHFSQALPLFRKRVGFKGEVPMGLGQFFYGIAVKPILNLDLVSHSVATWARWKINFLFITLEIPPNAYKDFTIGTSRVRELVKKEKHELLTQGQTPKGLRPRQYLSFGRGWVYCPAPVSSPKGEEPGNCLGNFPTVLSLTPF